MQVYNLLKSLKQARYIVLLLVVVITLPGALAAKKSPQQLQQEMLTEFDNRLAIEPHWSKRISVSLGKRFIKLQSVQGDDVLYSADWRGAVYAIDSVSGETLWQHQVDEIVSGGLTLASGLLLLGTSEGRLIALNSTDGTEVWRSQLSSEILSAPLLADGHVVVHSNDGYVYGLSASDGEQLWAYQYKVPALTLRGTSTPIYAGGLVLVGLDNGKLVALDIQSGSVRWLQTVAVPKGRSELQRMVDIDATPIKAGNAVYVVSYQGRVAALDIATGRVIWIREFSSFDGMAADSESLYVSDAEGHVSAINQATGATLWTQRKLAGLELTRPLINKGVLIIAADDGYLYWLATESGELLSRSAVKELAARLQGMEWDLWDDYDRSALPDFYDEDIGINVAPQQLNDGSLLVLDNLGYLTRFSH
ncbi:Outer membrane beta-barrel assembly protein BamB [hydrothermal vent metagenome]|uniref:Outer membrane beta-barrel assembly protein BamB n=1 Tax=hydrothermal vent metagenome TaxID=652676 RepID=A0A3B0ZCU0_9ZZZZ